MLIVRSYTSCVIQNHNMATQDLTAEQQALRESLMSQAEGGANTAVNLPYGTNVPSYLDANPATRQLLQEQINVRTYGTARPQFGTTSGGSSRRSAQQQPTPTTAPPQGQGQPGTEPGLISRIETAFPQIGNLSREELAAQEMSRIQDQIDALNRIYDIRVQEEQRRGEGRLGSTRSINALGGTLYDPFGAGRVAETEAVNQQAIGAVEAERANLIASLTNEAASRANAQFAEQTDQAIRRADSYVSAITNAYQLSQQEAQALRQEALQRAQLSGQLDGDPTLNYRQYLLDVTTQLETSRRADEQLELQRQQFERSGYETQVMPDGSLVAIDYSTFPPTTQVIGNYSRFSYNPVNVTPSDSSVTNTGTDQDFGSARSSVQ